MRRLKGAAVACGAILALSAVSASVRAEDAISYCRSYAHAAIDQSRAARAVGRCHHFVRENPARWSMNYADHFNWCKSVYGSGDNASERRAREEALNQCTR
jgi:hypothetical protein